MPAASKPWRRTDYLPSSVLAWLEKGHTLTELAKLLDVSRPTLRAKFAGKHGWYITEWRALQRACGTKIDELEQQRLPLPVAKLNGRSPHNTSTEPSV